MHKISQFVLVCCGLRRAFVVVSQCKLASRFGWSGMLAAPDKLPIETIQYRINRSLESSCVASLSFLVGGVQLSVLRGMLSSVCTAPQAPNSSTFPANISRKYTCDSNSRLLQNAKSTSLSLSHGRQHGTGSTTLQTHLSTGTYRTSASKPSETFSPALRSS